MSTKKSAFSVFRSKEKSEPAVPQLDEDDLTLVSVKKTNSSQLEVEKVVSYFLLFASCFSLLQLCRYYLCTIHQSIVAAKSILLINELFFIRMQDNML